MNVEWAVVSVFLQPGYAARVQTGSKQTVGWNKIWDFAQDRNNNPERGKGIWGACGRQNNGPLKDVHILTLGISEYIRLGDKRELE